MVNVPDSGAKIAGQFPLDPVYYRFLSDLKRELDGKQASGDYQPLAALLTAIANLSMVADRYIYGTGTDTVALGTITAFARSILDDANAAAVLTTLGVTADAQLLLSDADVPRLGTANAWDEAQTIDDFNAAGTSAGCRIGIIGTTSRVLTSQTGTTPAIHHGFYNFNGLVGTITTNGSATQYNTSSDRRLKDITGDMDIEAARATIAAIQLREFTWKADGASGRGVIADELQKIAPEAVTGGVGGIEEEWAVDAKVHTILRKEGERGLDVISSEKPDADSLHKLGERISPQGVDYSKLVPDLIGAVQSLMAEVNDLKTEIAGLKTKPAGGR